MSRLLRASLVLALLCLTASTIAKPASPACGRGPWLALVWSDQWNAEQRQAVLEHLRRGFEIYGVSVCERGAAPEPPLAEVSFGDRADDSVSLSVDVRDSVTKKRLGRDVDVRGYSKEARALAVAIATEELVRASWVELELDSPRDQRAVEPRGTEPTPDVVHRVNQATLGTDTTRLRIDLRGAFETYAAGQTHFGGDLALRQDLSTDLGLGFALGPRVALREASRLGDVETRLLTAEAFGLLNLIRTAILRVDWEIGLRGGLARFASSPNSGSEVTESAALLVLKTSVALDLALDATWYSTLNAGTGHSLVGATATARGREVTGMSGLELHGALGLGGRW